MLNRLLFWFSVNCVKTAYQKTEGGAFLWKVIRQSTGHNKSPQLFAVKDLWFIP